jgi:hypothetical protein
VNHDQLATDLAAQLRADRRMVWRDVQLGPSGSPRPDVYAIFKSFAHPAPMAYECKVTRADLLSDVTSGKWQTYLAYASGVVFAMTADLAKSCRVVIPAHAGLIVRGERWRMAKRPVLNPVTIPQDALLKLLIDGVEREGPQHRARHWSPDYDVLRKKVGQAAAQYLRDAERARIELEDCQHQAKYIVERANEEAETIREQATANDAVRAELIAVLGLPPHSSRWNIQEAVRRLREETRKHPAQQQLERLTSSLQHALTIYGAKSDEQEPAA